ncbi:MAG: hypothetical protein WCC67_07340, partial [Candidatus Acidiferrales bacterium]
HGAAAVRALPKEVGMLRDQDFCWMENTRFRVYRPGRLSLNNWRTVGPFHNAGLTGTVREQNNPRSG